jgi:anion-transporting  ArsA/GET3 family ATPase
MNISGQNLDAVTAVLQVLADPAAFKSQIKALQAVIDENKKFVELVAPAGELMNLLEKQKSREAEADKALTEATQKAEKLIATAEAQALSLQTTARAEAEDLRTRAEAVLDQAQVELKEAAGQKTAVAATKKRAKELEMATAALAETQAALDAELVNATAAKLAAEAARQEYMDKLDKLKAL